MVRKIAFLLMAGGFVLTGAWAPQPSAMPAFKAAFCPECWKIHTDNAALDMEGRCRGCSRTPVTVEAVSVSWFWCAPHQAWHRRPCSKDPIGLGAGKVSAALLVPAGSERIASQAYCPEDQALTGVENVGLKCPVCAKPLVRAESVERRWYWCSSDKVWHKEPCPMNRVAHCCKARTGTVLAYPLQVPILGEVSFRGPYLNDMLVSPDWLAAHLDDPHLAVLHIEYDPENAAPPRRPTYMDGHILGARPVAWGEIARTRHGLPNELPPVEDLVAFVRSLGIDENDRVILYDTGAGLEAARAYLTLDYLGLGRKASVLDGQWTLWKAMALPETRMPAEAGEPSAFVPRLQPEILVTLNAMRDLSWVARLVPTTVALVDARAEPEYSGLEAGKGILRAGHIPGAVNLCWQKTLVSEADPIFRSEDELRAAFEEAGARPGRGVVTYCRTGVDAAHLYFVAKYLGYPVQLYDGSYYEWSRAEESPVEGRWALR
jgi:thiosulfate/3-mercaptopyruvate sulfurtransferase